MRADLAARDPVTGQAAIPVPRQPLELDLQACIQGMEALAIAAAFDPSAPAGVPAT